MSKRIQEHSGQYSENGFLDAEKFRKMIEKIDYLNNKNALPKSPASANKNKQQQASKSHLLNIQPSFTTKTHQNNHQQAQQEQLYNQIHKSLINHQHYIQKQTKINKFHTKITQKILQNYNNGFHKILNYSLHMPPNIQQQQLDQQQVYELRNVINGLQYGQQIHQLPYFVDQLCQRNQEEKYEEREFIELIVQALYEDEEVGSNGAVGVVEVVRGKYIQVVRDAFWRLFRNFVNVDEGCNGKSKEVILEKVVLRNMFRVINEKIGRVITGCFTKIKQYRGEMVPRIMINFQRKYSDKSKGEVLQNIRSKVESSLYFGLRPLFWRWYFKTTQAGSDQICTVANRLVLDTNINKITAFYRLFQVVKKKQPIITARIKRICAIFSMLSKNLFIIMKKDGFDGIKQVSMKNKNKKIEKLIKFGLQKRNQAMGIWLKKTRRLIDRERNNEKITTAYKIVNNAEKRQKAALKIWLLKIMKLKQNQNCQKNYLLSILKNRIFNLSKIILIFRSLPQAKLPKVQNIRSKEGLQNKLLNTLALIVHKKKYNYFNDIKNKINTKITRPDLHQITNIIYSRYRFFLDVLKQRQITANISNRYTKLIKNFNQIDKIIKNNTDYVFRNNPDYRNKNKAIELLMRILCKNIGLTFQIWRKYNNRFDQNDYNSEILKKMNIRNLNNMLKQFDEKRYRNNIRKIIEKFIVNLKQIQARKRALKKIADYLRNNYLFGFKKINNMKSKPKFNKQGFQFFMRLDKFAEKKLYESFKAFKQDYIEGKRIKKDHLKKINQTLPLLQVQALNDWLKIVKQQKELQKYTKFSQFCDIVKKKCQNNFQIGFEKKYPISSYMGKIKNINKYFSKLADTTKQNVKLSLFKVSQCDKKPYERILNLQNYKNMIIPQNNSNKWFNKSSKILCLNTKINMQKSMWRFQQFYQTNSQNLNTRQSHNRQQYVNKVKYANKNVEKKSQNISKDDNRAFLTKKVGVSIIVRILKSKLSHILSHVYNNINNSRSKAQFINTGNQYRSANKQLSTNFNQAAQYSSYQHFSYSSKTHYSQNRQINTNPFQQNYQFWTPIAKRNLEIQQQPQYPTLMYRNQPKISSVINLSMFLTKNSQSLMSSGFHQLLTNMLSKRNEKHHQFSLNQHLQLLSQHSTLLQQLRQYREQNQQLYKVSKDKSVKLHQANYNLQILKTKIDVMIINKFVSMIDKIQFNMLLKRYDWGFDAIIDQANYQFTKMRDYRE